MTRMSLSSEATEFGASVHQKLERLGGIKLYQRGTLSPEMRASLGSELSELGLWELDISAPQELEAAAAATRAAGFHALPYPLAERLAHPDPDGAVAVVGGRGSVLVAHGDLPLTWTAVDLDGATHGLEAQSTVTSPLSDFIVKCVRIDTRPGLEHGPALAVVLQSWWLLGLVERAYAETLSYVTERRQFGRAVWDNQAVQFDITKVHVAQDRLHELAMFGLWSVGQPHRTSLWPVDAWGGHVTALETTALAMGVAHQLHGAMGFCQETPIPWLGRASQSRQRLPFNVTTATEVFVDAVLTEGFEQIFPVAPFIRTDDGEESPWI